MNVPLKLKELLWIINKNLIPNCPVTREDVKLADEIFGASLVALKGKTVRKLGKHVRVAIAKLPNGIESKYSKIELGADVMFVNGIRLFVFVVNGIRLFVTISRHLQFATVEAITNAISNSSLLALVPSEPRGPKQTMCG